MDYIIPLVFIALDLITGLIKAFKEKNYSSSIMREGLYHKCGSLLCIALGFVVDHAQHYLNLGIDIKIHIPICIYICVMEIGSIIENIAIINPEIMSDKLKQYFNKLSKK